jgi:hypothetical protein
MWCALERDAEVPERQLVQPPTATAQAKTAEMTDDVARLINRILYLDRQSVKIPTSPDKSRRVELEAPSGIARRLWRSALEGQSYSQLRLERREGGTGLPEGRRPFIAVEIGEVHGVEEVKHLPH